MSMHFFVDCAATGLPIYGAMTLSLLALWMLMNFIVWAVNWDFVALYSLLFYSFAIFSRRLRFTCRARCERKKKLWSVRHLDAHAVCSDFCFLGSGQWNWTLILFLFKVFHGLHGGGFDMIQHIAKWNDKGICRLIIPCKSHNKIQQNGGGRPLRKNWTKTFGDCSQWFLDWWSAHLNIEKNETCPEHTHSFVNFFRHSRLKLLA